jgi:S1-C subfamily serine protease
VVRVTATTSAGIRNEGSGFIARFAGGSAHIVTAANVVEGAAKVEVEFFTQRARPLAVKITYGCRRRQSGSFDGFSGEGYSAFLVAVSQLALAGAVPDDEPAPPSAPRVAPGMAQPGRQ